MSLRTATKMSSSLMRNFPVSFKLSAKMLRRSSESDEVLICRCATASMNCKSAVVLIRFPFCRNVFGLEFFNYQPF